MDASGNSLPPRFYSPSPNLSPISCRIAASACSASAPSASTVTLEPLPAASIITPMMLLALTRRPLRVIQISEAKAVAVWVSFAEARACRPSLLTISVIALAIAALVRVHVHDALAAAGARLLHHLGERLLAMRERPHQHRQVGPREALHLAVLQELGRHVRGRGAEHVGEHQYARAVVDARQRFSAAHQQGLGRIGRADADMLGARRLPAQRVCRRAQQRFAQGPVRNEKDPDHYFYLEIFFSKESRNIPETSKPVWSWISRKPVGLVTLISVSQSPMTSRPTRSRFLFARTGPIAAAISRCLGVSGWATPRAPAARLPRF